MPDDEIVIELYGDETVRVLVNDNLRMTPGKLAAQAVHAALAAYSIPHGRVIVLGGRPGQIRRMPAVIRDAGWTELAPGTVTAGAALERASEPVSSRPESCEPPILTACVRAAPGQPESVKLLARLVARFARLDGR